jgi:hypothetical protein
MEVFVCHLLNLCVFKEKLHKSFTTNTRAMKIGRLNDLLRIFRSKKLKIKER